MRLGLGVRQTCLASKEKCACESLYLNREAGWLYCILEPFGYKRASQVALVVKNLPANTGDVGDKGSIPGSVRSLGGGNDNLFQYSCLKIPIDRGAWQTTVQRVAKTWTQLNTLNSSHFLSTDSTTSYSFPICMLSPPPCLL